MPETKRAGKLFVLSGPSGVGKGTVLWRVQERVPRLRKSVSVTTRPPAPTETPGEEYDFVSEAEFQRLLDAGAFLEWAEVHGHHYGTPEAWVDEQLAQGIDVVLEIDVQGGKQVAEKRPDACLIFLHPPSLDELNRRLRGRGRDSEAAVARRMKQALYELSQAPCYHHQIVNDDLDRTVEEIARVILAERKKQQEP